MKTGLSCVLAVRLHRPGLEPSGSKSPTGPVCESISRPTYNIAILAVAWVVSSSAFRLLMRRSITVMRALCLGGFSSSTKPIPPLGGVGLETGGRRCLILVLQPLPRSTNEDLRYPKGSMEMRLRPVSFMGCLRAFGSVLCSSNVSNIRLGRQRTPPRWCLFAWQPSSLLCC